jgi:hypothetical protein
MKFYFTPLCLNTGCLKKSFKIIFQMLLCCECYEKVTLKGVQTMHRSTP